MAVVCDMRWMNSTDPSAKPTTMASVRSRKTVRRNVTSSTAASPREATSRRANACFSTIVHATTASTPASAASGMNDASGAATSMNASRTTACSMPDTGLVAPALTLVAVRAIVPVTQKPPNSAEAMLAAPCPTSSQLERCRRPVMPSATVAESSDSMEPSSANETAAGIISTTLAAVSSGSAGAGRLCGMPPKREPMVATSSPNSAVSAAAPATAISMPGQRGRNRRNAAITPITPNPSAIDTGEAVGSAATRTGSFSGSGPGSGAASVRPRRSLIWLAKMMTAIPAVKPTVTG